MKLLPNNRRTPEHLLTKKITILAKGANKSPEGYHRKVNTQNINIYNIINKNTLKKPVLLTQEQNSFALEKTFDIPSQLVKPKPKSRHDFELEQELKLYRSEIEFRFKNSKVNQTYIYPRKGGTTSPESNYHTSWTEMIPVSIYDVDMMERNNSTKHKLKIPQRKSRSHDKTGLYIKGNIHNYIKDIIKTNLHKDNLKKRNAQISLYNNSFGKYTQLGIVSQKAVNSKMKPFFCSESDKQENNRLQTSEGLYSCTKEGHYRTKTFNPLETTCNFNPLKQKKVKNITNNSKDMVGNMTEYFKALIINNRNTKYRNRTKIIIKSKDAKEFNNTPSLNTFFNYNLQKVK